MFIVNYQTCPNNAFCCPFYLVRGSVALDKKIIMRKILTILTIIASVTIVAAKAKEAFVCKPCNRDCDKAEYVQKGTCTHCGMELIEKTKAMEIKKNKLKIAFYLQDGVEVLDFAGPMEVFSYAGFEVFTVSLTKEPIVSQGILTIVPDYSIADAPKADILAFFGGNSGEGFKYQEITDWIKGQNDIQYYFSVCTGAFALGKAGLLDGQTATTFHESINSLREQFPKADVRDNVRFVDNGKVVTTAGISAGIDGALHLVQKILGKKKAIAIAEEMEYDKWQAEEGLIMQGAEDYKPN